jgi:peptide/nickel transport system ATP-binding protein
MSGEILFNGKDLLKLTKRELQVHRGKDIAMVFQDPMTSMNPVLTIGEQIIETLLRQHSCATHRPPAKKQEKNL